MDLITLQYFIGLIGGILLLWWAGEKAVSYSQEISHLFGFSTFFIGFAFLAISTGLPELSVTISSIIKGVPGLSAGTIIGSNFSDIALVLGIPAMIIGTINVCEGEFRNLIFILFITVLIMSSVFIIGTLTKVHGVLLICLYFFCLWILWKARYAKKIIKESAEASEKKAEEAAIASKFAGLIKLFSSLIGLIVASELSVRSALALAETFNMSLELVGSTIFAVGTSLPELTVSLTAVKKKDYSLALGNALGSVLEQGTLILGVLALGSRSPVHLQYLRSIAPFMFLAFGIVGYGMIKRSRISRKEGIALTALYAAFLFYHYLAPLYLTK